MLVGEKVKSLTAPPSDHCIVPVSPMWAMVSRPRMESWKMPSPSTHSPSISCSMVTREAKSPSGNTRKSWCWVVWASSWMTDAGSLSAAKSLNVTCESIDCPIASKVMGGAPVPCSAGFDFDFEAIHPE